MSKISFHLLEPLRFPLINRLYKSYYPAGKAKKDEVIWIGEANQILCCVRFKQFDEFQLLTGMLVHPEHRGEGIATELLKATKEQIKHKPCYCFAFTHLEELYESQGFTAIETTELPESLRSRLVRYQASGKRLIPMRFIQ